MKRRKSKARGLILRGGRWHGDFRAWSDVGGRREPLCPAGVKLGTPDATEAALLYARRVEYYEKLRHHKTITGISEATALAPFARYHLDVLKNVGNLRPNTVRRYAHALANCIERLGAGTLLTEITTATLTAYIGRRQADGAATASIRSELVALSRLFRRALAEGRAVINPIALVDKPTIQDHEAVWLTLEEGWRLLEAAKQYDAETGKGFLARGMLYPMIATFLLTGARRDECFALRRSDMDYEARVVHIRAYGDHRLKRGHARVVPLWPQLADILRDYLRSRPAHISNLLFPSPTPHVRYGVKSWRLEKIETALTWAEKAAKLDRHVTLHTCRHSYASNRLRTVEQGPDGQRIPVSLFRVSRELGHQSTRLLETTYGHIETDPAKMAMEVRYAAKQKSPHQASTGTAS